MLIFPKPIKAPSISMPKKTRDLINPAAAPGASKLLAVAPNSFVCCMGLEQMLSKMEQVLSKRLRLRDTGLMVFETRPRCASGQQEESRRNVRCIPLHVRLAAGFYHIQSLRSWYLKNARPELPYFQPVARALVKPYGSTI